MFTVCVNLCDVGEHFTNTKNQQSIRYMRIITEPIPNYVQENFCGKSRSRNVRTNRLKEVKIQLGRHFNSHRRESHGCLLQDIPQRVYHLNLYSPFRSIKFNQFEGD
jgi:hypothetical protein